MPDQGWIGNVVVTTRSRIGNQRQGASSSEVVSVTEPALSWRPIDAAMASQTCCYADCNQTSIAMRGPSSPRLRLVWRGYCRAHAAMYGATGRRLPIRIT